MLSGGALVGAPLGHDFAVISLSDLLTPCLLYTSITLPKGESISIDITDTQIDGDSVTCTVKKYSGGDPDITNGILVCATVRKNSGGIDVYKRQIMS